MEGQTRMKILRNFAAGATATTIGHSLRLQTEEVDAVLTEFGHRRDLASAEARRLRTGGTTETVVPDGDLFLAPQVEVSADVAPLPVMPRPQSDLADSIGTLLDEATKAGGKFAATARRVHVLVEQLRRDMDDQHEVLEAQRRVEEARAALNRAQARLKAVKAGERPAPDRPPGRELRQWARANGVECPQNGRVPKAVVEAWDAAHQEAAA